MQQPEGHVQRIDAITFATANMAESVGFYRALGFVETFGDSSSAFVTLESGSCFVNLWLVGEEEMSPRWWGRVIFHVDDVDEFYKRAIAAGLSPAAEPKTPLGVKGFSLSPTRRDTTSALPRELGTEGRRGRMTFDSGEDRYAGFPQDFSTESTNLQTVSFIWNRGWSLILMKSNCRCR